MSDGNLKKAGLKVTGPRLKILQVLSESTDRHLRAEDIYKILNKNPMADGIALATVYRVLTQFETAGLVIKHRFEGGQSFFELDDGEHHEHLVCVCCGLVEEFVDPIIEARQAEIAKQKKFQLTDHYLHLYGICKNCQKLKL